MTIHDHDHILRYRFDSDGRPDIAHVVDLGEFDGFGECSCEDYQYRILPVLRRRQMGIAEEMPKRCKHISAAREHLLDRFIDRIAST
jgi:hypothetical protein